jgi:hypothetical protein
MRLLLGILTFVLFDSSKETWSTQRILSGIVKYSGGVGLSFPVSSFLSFSKYADARRIIELYESDYREHWPTHELNEPMNLILFNVLRGYFGKTNCKY